MTSSIRKQVTEGNVDSEHPPMVKVPLMATGKGRDVELNAKLFRQATAGQMVANQNECVTIREDQPMNEALEMMANRSFSALPVRNSKDQFTGILNLSDIAAHLSGFVHGPSTSTTGKSPAVGGGAGERHIDERLAALKEVPSSLFTTPVKQLVGLSWESRHMIMVDATERLDNIISKLACGDHRLLVKGKGWHQVLSQWDIAVWLARHNIGEEEDPNMSTLRRGCISIGSIGDASLAELGIATPKRVVTIPWNITARAGFHTLSQHGVSAMPIMNKDGNFISTLSSSDLRGISSEKLKALQLPVLDFLQVCNAARYHQVTAHPTTSLGEVLRRLVSRDVHRVWVMSDDNNEVISVVSITDILHLIDRLMSPSGQSKYSGGSSSGYGYGTMMEQPQSKGAAVGSGSGVASGGSSKPSELHGSSAASSTTAGSSGGMKCTECGCSSDETSRGLASLAISKCSCSSPKCECSKSKQTAAKPSTMPTASGSGSEQCTCSSEVAGGAESCSCSHPDCKYKKSSTRV